MERGIFFNGHITNYIKGGSLSLDRALFSNSFIIVIIDFI